VRSPGLEAADRRALACSNGLRQFLGSR
jgi:hypothetical protein